MIGLEIKAKIWHISFLIVQPVSYGGVPAVLMFF